jgi:hypothetical protein
MPNPTSPTQTSLTVTPAQPNAGPVSHLRQEYDLWQTRFESQPALIQRFLEAQAGQLATALTQRTVQVRFTLPDRLVLEAGQQPVPVPAEFREQMAGGLMDRLTGSDGGTALRQRLAELDQSPNRALALSAGLLRHATATHMVYAMLPTGRSITYLAAEGEEIPTLPSANDLEPASAITTATDAIAEEGTAEAGRGDLQVPYVPAARRFYMPQWVAFGEADALLVKSVNEAEAHLGSMQRFLSILHMAVSLAPYIVVDEAYQQKRYGMLGQLVNQGRALARYETAEIVRAIRRRAGAQDLNRGLSLSLPYFDDQSLQMRTHNFEVIPAGRIMFVPAFVVRAAREEQAKVAQDTRLSISTRKYLLNALKTLEAAFESLSN